MPRFIGCVALRAGFTTTANEPIGKVATTGPSQYLTMPGWTKGFEGHCDSNMYLIYQLAIRPVFGIQISSSSSSSVRTLTSPRPILSPNQISSLVPPPVKMQIKALILSALTVTAVSAHSRRQAEGEEKPFGCTAPRPTEAQLAIAAAMAEQEALEGSNVTVSARATIAVDVYFHVVASSTALTDGYVTVWLLPPPPLQHLNELD